MEQASTVAAFWRAAITQDAAALKAYFTPDARVRWVCTNEAFTAEEYITANCAYPGDWRVEVERVEETGALVITAARVWLADGSASFHAVSFFEFRESKICTLDEYWGDDGPPPEWRREKHLGKPIRTIQEASCLKSASFQN